MPRRSAAWMTVSAVLDLDRAAVDLDRGHGLRARRRRPARQRAAAERGVLLELGAELGDEGSAPASRRASASAQMVLPIMLSATLEQQVDVARRARRRPRAGSSTIVAASRCPRGTACTGRTTRGGRSALRIEQRPHHADVSSSITMMPPSRGTSPPSGTESMSIATSISAGGERPASTRRPG